MIRRLNSTSTFKVVTNRAVYAVNLEHLKNTQYGQPRFKATVITLRVFTEQEPDGCFFTAVWTFKGHYMNDSDEAAWIVERYEEKLKEEGKE